MSRLRDVVKEVGASSEVQPRPKDRDAEFRVHDPDGNAIDLVCSRRWPVQRSRSVIDDDCSSACAWGEVVIVVAGLGTRWLIIA